MFEYKSRHRYPRVSAVLQYQRDFVHAFKMGTPTFTTLAASLVAARLKQQYSPKVLARLTFFCIPASTPERQELRYKFFSSLVCSLTGMRNGYDFVNVTSERTAVHCLRLEGEVTTREVNYSVNLPEDIEAVVFDDVITQGLSYDAFGDALENAGAVIRHAIFLSRSKD